MKRRDLMAAAALPFAAGAAPARPNILILHCHDLGQFLGCYGIKTVHTPNLDRFAESGVLFERNFCAAPQCSPSRASIFTGRYPHSNGVLGLTHAEFAWDLNPDERHLGQILSAAGYATAGVGVIHETRSGASRAGLDDYAPASRVRQMADAVIERIARFAKSPGSPFYIQAGCIEPHRLAPRDPRGDVYFTDAEIRPDDSLGVHIPGYLLDTPGARAEMAEIQGSVRHVDEHMGRVLKALDGSGLAAGTLVVFTADHGIAMPRAKCSLYEPGLQTPLILRLPSRNGWHGGARRRELISNVDYLPTILEAAGLPVPPNVQGRSFAPLLDGRAWSPRQEVFGELTYHGYYDPCRSVRTAQHKLIVNFSSAPSFQDPSQSWRPRADTAVPPNPARAFHPPFELYDLAQDPFEQKNVAAEAAYAAVLKDLRARLRRHMENTRDPLLQGAVVCPLHRKSMEWLRQS